ncbi:MAG: Mrp/NBP35 family ATP-binding protein [Dehalococcoidia bacterium]|nr:Mrp/NBP35 family ATP-binding protein [Dehalococcoidia bacterium]
MTSNQPKMTPEMAARLEAMKRQWDSKRRLEQKLSAIKYKIAVYSGKGGVGKTTVAVNLAVLLADKGFKVGLFDVDIDCPNVVKVMKLQEQPLFKEDKTLYPPEKYGVKVISMSLFQEKEEEAIIFRGPMIHNAITQFLEMTEWGPLDFLIIDMPPGTSDAALTTMQTFKLEGFIIVATPQELAVLDATRSINMVKKMKVNVLGVVENFVSDFFGEGGAEEMAHRLGVKFLGKIHLSKDFRKTEKPTVLLSKSVREEFERIWANVELPAPASAAPAPQAGGPAGPPQKQG